MKKKEIRIGIFDLTDCEGCELQFLAVREDLAKRGHDFEITNWRLASSVREPGPFDVTFIEGSPISDADVELVKKVRAVSDKIVTLGTCAALGGVQSALPDQKRNKYLKEIYGEKYKSNSRSPRPVSYYIEVDIHLPGCPVAPKELERLLACLFAGKEFTPAYFPVCLECKERNNACLYLDEGFCLGPVTQGGCGAPCPTAGLRCYGCLGPLAGANLAAIKKSKVSAEEAERAMDLYFKHAEGYKELKAKGK